MAYKPRIESNNLDLTSILSTINELPEASKGASLDVIAVSELPATVVENQIVVITDTPAGTIYVDTDEPANPASGDVWVMAGSSDYGVDFSETFRNGLIGAKQLSDGKWVRLDGYVGVAGAWQRFALGFPVIGTPLENWTWEQIIALANSEEDCSKWFAVGDEKNLVLTTGEIVPLVIGDFYHNTITNSNGKKAAIAFTLKNCLNTTYPMNTSATNVGGWNDSNMRATHVASILDTFPAELRAEGAVKYVDVVATAGNKATNLVTSSDRLRLHSLTELGLSYQYAGTEGTGYAYYASGNRIKTANGTTVQYWVRSPYTNNSTNFCTVNSIGEAAYGFNANYSRNVACCFDV